MNVRRGFSLVEVLVSIFIVSVLLLLVQAIIYSAVLTRNSKNQSIALAIARNEIESLRSNGYANLPANGSFADSLLSTLPSATTTLTVSVYNAKTKQVTASVIWKNSSSAASTTVSLSTLLTETGGLP